MVVLKTISIFILLFALGCSSLIVSDVPMQELEKNDEFDNLVVVKEVSPPATTKVLKPLAPTKKVKKKKEVKKKPKPAKKIKKKTSQKRQPKLEDRDGFVGRRPMVDPFRSGEKVGLRLSYLNMDAGVLNLEVLPMVEVNGHKAYKYKVSVKSSSMFSLFYKLDNTAETFVDYETLLPYSHAVHIKESKQVKVSRSFYDWKKLSAKYWEKRITDDGETQKKVEWKLEPYSQNLISTLFYLRNFQLTKGKTIKYRLGDAGKQHIIHVDVLRNEKLKTKVGELDTVVVKVRYETDGTFAQAGDILFWLTNDERKFLVKLKSKIKIGAIYGELEELIR